MNLDRRRLPGSSFGVRSPLFRIVLPEVASTSKSKATTTSSEALQLSELLLMLLLFTTDILLSAPSLNEVSLNRRSLVSGDVVLWLVIIRISHKSKRRIDEEEGIHTPHLLPLKCPWESVPLDSPELRRSIHFR